MLALLNFLIPLGINIVGFAQLFNTLRYQYCWLCSTFFIPLGINIFGFALLFIINSTVYYKNICYLLFYINNINIFSF